jgi:hypothetical protein
MFTNDIKSLPIEFNNVFAWNYKELKVISKNLCEHKNELMANGQPIKQKQYCMNPNYTQWVWEDLDISWIFYLSHSSSPMVIPSGYCAK